jgi:hypothetical protein
VKINGKEIKIDEFVCLGDVVPILWIWKFFPGGQHKEARK